MSKQEIIERVKAVVNAPTCCPELKESGEEYLASLGTEKEKETAKSLVAELEADVMPIDSVIGFMSSAAGEAKVGAQMAADILAHAKEIKAHGGMYCDCPACAPGKIILDNRAAIL